MGVQNPKVEDHPGSIGKATGDYSEYEPGMALELHSPAYATKNQKTWMVLGIAWTYYHHQNMIKEIYS